MFDLIELDRAEIALQALGSGCLPAARRPEPAREELPRGDVSRCPFHNGTIAREDVAA